MRAALVILPALLALATRPAAAQRILHVDFLAENPGVRDYLGVVWIPGSDLAPLLPRFDGFSFVVTTTNSPDLARDLAERRAFELPSQALDEDGDGKPERIAVYLSLQAGEKKVITLHSGTPEEMVRLKARYPSAAAAERILGSGAAIWESDKVAYSWRQKGGEVFPIAKPSARSIFGQLPMARLLRAGDAAFETAGPPGAGTQAEVLASGPVAAGVRVSGAGANSVYVIGRNGRWTFVRTEYRAGKAKPQIGIAQREREAVVSGDGWIATRAGEPAVGLAIFVPAKYRGSGAAAAEPGAGGNRRRLDLRPDANGRVEYAFAAYPAAEHQENVVEPGETGSRIPEVPGSEQYGPPSTRILQRPARLDAEAFRRELAADVQALANPPRVTRISSQAVTYSSLLPADALRSARAKTYDEAIDLILRRVRSMTEQAKGKWWFSSDPSGKPAYKFPSWGTGYLVSMLWDGFQVTGDAWYKTAALAANRQMLGGEELDRHSTGLNYWNASVRSYRATGDPRWRSSAIQCADMIARIAEPATGLIQENGPSQRQKPDDPYHRSNYLKIDAVVAVPILWWAYEETKDQRYLEAARRHFASTMKLLIEPDGAALQMLWLKPGSTEVLGVGTHQGYGGNSRWARGLAWVLDGFPDAYRATRDPAYRAVFERSARWLEANLPEDLASWYDFDDQAVFWRYRDSSTSAISAYGLLRMSALEPDPALARFYQKLGTSIVDSLIDHYLTPVGVDDGRPPGMLAHATYTKPEEGEFLWGNFSLLRSLCWLREKGASRRP